MLTEMTIQFGVIYIDLTVAVFEEYDYLEGATV